MTVAVAVGEACTVATVGAGDGGVGGVVAVALASACAKTAVGVSPGRSAMTAAGTSAGCAFTSTGIAKSSLLMMPPVKPGSGSSKFGRRVSGMPSPSWSSRVVSPKLVKPKGRVKSSPPRSLPPGRALRVPARSSGAPA